MRSNERMTVDGNTAAARVAHRTSEAIAIFPITPSSPMAELADEWSAAGEQNIWGGVPRVFQMQSEAGVAGALHGSLLSGALTTTFTSSQGLLLMVPNFFKIAGELTPAVVHVAARSVATHALSIFGDHSDVMAARSTGWSMLSSASVQEAQDFALIALMATLESRVPVLHFFDGFRTSHEINTIAPLHEDTIRALIDDELVQRHRQRSLDPDAPGIRGTAQNPDVFFQAREACNPYYEAAPAITKAAMERFGAATGRYYDPFEYVGAPDAERVLVMMGSGCGAAEEAINALVARGERVGMLKVRLFRPFAAADFVSALPATTRRIAVLDRTKEPGAPGEPLYQDVVTAVAEQVSEGTAPFAAMPLVVGGRYGLSSKEFTPQMAGGVFSMLGADRPKNHFTVGIVDDVSNTSIPTERGLAIDKPAGIVEAMFFGLGSDGTVGANKETVKIVGEQTDQFGQGYFVYDSKKSGSVTISHLRFSPEPISSTYTIEEAGFVACHQFQLLDRLNIAGRVAPGGTLLLNSPHGREGTWDHLPREVQEAIIDRQLRVFVIDGNRIARDVGLAGRIGTVLQPCFMALAGILPAEQAIDAMKQAVRKKFALRGEEVVRQNYAAIDAALSALEAMDVPASPSTSRRRPPVVSAQAPCQVQHATAPMMAGAGDSLPVSAFVADGSFPSGTARWEKRGIADAIPSWDPALCIDCAKCVLVCPHAAIRMKVVEPGMLASAPEEFQHKSWMGKDFPGWDMGLQVSPDDCTGCGICADVCPALSKRGDGHRALEMTPLNGNRERELRNWDYFEQLPLVDRTQVRPETIKGSQLLEPLFEFSGACAGCGETPYLKLLSQLFGDRAVISNATGCSSIYGGNLPTTPWSINSDGRGPAWANSLFEDNAEFGLGMRVALDQREDLARRRLEQLAPVVGEQLATDILDARQESERDIAGQRERVTTLKRALREVSGEQQATARDLLGIADALVKRTVWIVGGDGWAYDIGFGGLDHVLASGQNVNILVLDTEAYSNTGGQMSKATGRGAIAKFAAAGKRTPKKDLGACASSYDNVYVASVAMGADNAQVVKAFVEAEAHEGPSIIIAYSHCIAHGIDMSRGMSHQREAVESGYWPLYRSQPAETGGHILHLDSGAPRSSFRGFALQESRYAMLGQANPEHADQLLDAAQSDIERRRSHYEERSHGG